MATTQNIPTSMSVYKQTHMSVCKLKHSVQLGLDKHYYKIDNFKKLLVFAVIAC